MKILILIPLILLIRWLIKTVNGFQKKEIRVQESLSGIEVALTKRYDLLTKSDKRKTAKAVAPLRLWGIILLFCRYLTSGLRVKEYHAYVV